MSLRARLLAGMAFIAVVLVVVLGVITVTIRDQLIGQIDDRLLVFSGGGPNGGDRFPAEMPLPEPGQTFPIPAPATDGAERLSDLYQGFVDADGVLRTRFAPNFGIDELAAPDLGGVTLPGEGSAIFTVPSIEGDVTYRVRAQRIGDIVAITALPIDDVQDTIDRLILFEVLGALAILAALGVVSWWVVHLGIRPIKTMTETATEIAGGDLTVRVPEAASGTEAAELAVALNTMLGHIETAMDESAESQERLRRFVADASHELRTPVTTIRGYAELYRHGGLAEPDALADAMRRTEQEAARMSRLVEDMLLLARLDEQRPVERAPVDLAALAGDAGADARAAAPDRVVRVEGADEPLLVLGDDDRLRQVIANVVGNALVHTDVTVPITIRVSRAGTDAVLEVEDRGDGMPAEIADRAMERFFRADPARSRHRGGSGLGLAIVDATVTAHGGAVELDSQPGVGTTVRLRLPVGG